MFCLHLLRTVDIPCLPCVLSCLWDFTKTVPFAYSTLATFFPWHLLVFHSGVTASRKPSLTPSPGSCHPCVLSTSTSMDNSLVYLSVSLPSRGHASFIFVPPLPGTVPAHSRWWINAWTRLKNKKEKNPKLSSNLSFVRVIISQQLIVLFSPWASWGSWLVFWDFTRILNVYCGGIWVCC
jgi:hypothetical protein